MTVLTGTAGNDPLYGGSGNDSLTGLAGDDSLYGLAGNDTLVGGDGNDYLSKYNEPGGSLLQGGAGQDTLLGGTQNDTLDGGDGDDPWLEGYAGNDSILGGAGNDQLTGDEGDDSLDGGAGNDTLYGGDGNDSLVGGDGNDELWDQSSGNDTLLGGAGDDKLSTYTSTGSDSLDGGAGNDSLTGGLGNDTLLGGDGNDSLSGQEGNDSLDGGVGKDTLFGGDGNDSLVGGEGNDELWDQNSGNDTLLGGAGDDMVSTYGSTGSDSLDGGAGNDTLTGGLGNDTLLGGDGNDSLSGQEGNDSLVGGPGNDSLYGEAGNDTLSGGTGTDLLSGGDGDDVYMIASRDFKLSDTGGNDTAIVSTSFVKLPRSIETVSYANGALALPYWLDTLLGGDGAQFAALLGPDKTFFYFYPGALPAYDTDPEHALGYLPFNEQQIAFSVQAMNYVSTVIDLRFAKADTVSALNTIAFANNTQADSAGYAYLPSGAALGSDVFLDRGSPDNLAPVDGSYAAGTVIHELGHAMGLKHPFQSDVNEAPYLPASENITAWTQMSYTRDPAQYHAVYSPLDIAALQYLYGPSTTARTGDDSYTVSASADNFIWDGAGKDTLSASTLSQPVTLYLEPGYWGYVGSKAATITSAGQVTVNFGSVIENLVGGAGNDSLYGNAAANTITGGLGDDTLYGAAGDDTLDGGSGIDTASYSGLKSDYTIAPIAGGYTVSGGSEGTDTLRNIEFVSFGGVAFALTVSDTTPPTATSFSPSDEALGVAVGSDIVLNFSEAIARGIGSIVLKTAAGATVAIYDAATSTNLTISGGTLSLNPTADLGYGTAYSVEFSAGSVKDLAGNAYAGTSSYNFTTAAYVNAKPTGAVSVTGQALQGQTLTAANTLADIDGLGAISYQWKADGSNIANATSITLVLTEAQVGKAITVAAGYTDGHGTVESVGSAASTPVANVNDAPTGAVAITGVATQGQTLAAANTLADIDGLGAISYQWKAVGINIANATSSTLVLTEAQVGKAITVVAGYTDGHGTVESVSSAATVPVVNVNDPGSVFINGTLAAGQTLTAVAADADGLGPVSYQWLADGVVIGGATAGSLLVSAAQIGHTVTVTAKYTDLHGTAESVSGGLGKVVDLLAYSWKAHTLLGAVDLSAAGHTASTSAGGTAGLTAGAGSSLDLTAARGVPSAEAAATSQAVNLQDAIAILKMIVGLDVNGAGKPLSPYQVYAADFDANGKVELSDAIAVLKHVVGLTSPDPQWIFFNETDSSVSSMLAPGKSSLSPGTVPAPISVDLSAAGPVPVGLVGVLRGDVDGSYAPAGNPLDLVSRAYFDTLVAGHPELSLSQFGVYP